MERRELLAGGSSLMAVALAGCAFGDESEASGPADDTGDTDDENDTDEESEESGGETETDDDTESAGNESDDATEDDGDNETDDDETVENETTGDDETNGHETEDGGNETTDESDGNETDSGDEESVGGDDAEESVLTIRVEDGDGEPVSEGVAVTITGESSGVSIAHNYQHDIEDGEIQQTVRAGSWTVAVEPAEGASFESQEEDVEIDGDEEVTIELDGAPSGESEAESEEETADGEDGGDTDDGSGDEGDEDDGSEEGDGNDDEDADTESDTGEDDEGATEEDDGDDATDDETEDGDDAAEEGDDETGTDSEDGTDASEPEPGEIPGLDRDALVAGGEVLAEIEVEREGAELVITAVPADESDGPRLQEVGAALDTTADAVSDPDALRSAIDRITVVVESAGGEELFSASGGTGWLLAFA